METWLTALAGPAGGAVLAFFVIRWIAYTWWPQQETRAAEREAQQRNDHKETIERILASHEKQVCEMTAAHERQIVTLGKSIDANTEAIKQSAQQSERMGNIYLAIAREKGIVDNEHAFTVLKGGVAT